MENIKNLLEKGLLKIAIEFYLKHYTNLYDCDIFWIDLENIKWKGAPYLSEDSYKGKEYFLFISDFEFNGKITHHKHSSSNDKKVENIHKKLSVKAYQYYNEDIISIDNVEVMDETQKQIHQLYNTTQKEINFRHAEVIDYYNNTFSKLSANDMSTRNQKHATSPNYYIEFVENYERIKISFGNVLLMNKYANRYTNNFELNEETRNINDRSYSLEKNFTLYDRLYLIYCENTFQSIYAFWEKIAFFLFQFCKIIYDDGLNNKNLSLERLIKELKKQKRNGLIDNPNLNWFIDFVTSDSSEFKALQEYRHPIVHYQLNKENPAGKGSLIASTINYWNFYEFDKTELDKLALENKNLTDTLKIQFNYCKEGFDKAIELAEYLKENSLKTENPDNYILHAWKMICRSFITFFKIR